MAKPVCQNKRRISKRKAKFENIGIKEKEVGTSVTKFDTEQFVNNTKKGQSMAVTVVPKKVNTTYLFTPYNWDSKLLTKQECLDLIWKRKYKRIRNKALEKIWQLVEPNLQEFEEDLYLTSLGMLAVGYVADKWGFTEYACKGKPGKTALNYVKKRYTCISGGRMYFYTPHMRSSGVLHTNGDSGDKASAYDYEIYLKQSEFVNFLENADKQRQLFVIPKWLENLVQIIDGIKGNCKKLDENGQELRDKDGKHILYDTNAIRQQLQIIKDFKQFEDVKDRVCEIIDNYPTDWKNQ